MAEKQRVFQLCESGLVIKKSYPAQGKFLRKTKELRSWLRFRDYCSPVKGLGQLGILPDNRLYQVIDERDAFPISPYRPTREIMDKMANEDSLSAEALLEEQSQQTKLKGKQLYHDAMSIAIMGIVFTFILVVLILVVKNINIGAYFNSFRGIR